jgi:hypothetical protein
MSLFESLFGGKKKIDLKAAENIISGCKSAGVEVETNHDALVIAVNVTARVLDVPVTVKEEAAARIAELRKDAESHRRMITLTQRSCKETITALEKKIEAARIAAASKTTMLKENAQQCDSRAEEVSRIKDLFS